jgi:hypothetical protein
MSAPRRPELKYEVTFTNARGEQRHAVVELTPEEVLDKLWHCVDGHSAGHPDGPMANMYAAHRAAMDMPDEFVREFPDVHRVVIH